MTRKHMKLPNGFGQITKLNKKNLRKPYRAMITVGMNPDTGKPIQKLLKPVSYFETYNDAYTALLENSKKPYNPNTEMTIAQLYKEWSEQSFPNLVDSSVKNYKACYRYIKSFHEYKAADCKPVVIKQILTCEGIPKSKISLVKVMLNLMFDYAVENEIVEKNYPRLTNTKNLISYDVKKGHKAFSNDELKTLWSHSDDPKVQWILINIYSGFRPGEMSEVLLKNIDFNTNIMIGGKKTDAGKERPVPIHPDIRKFVLAKHNIAKNKGNDYLGYKYYIYYFRDFNTVLEKYNLNTDHSPHDCRKTFITLAKKYNLDEYAIKRIAGHAIKDITEKIYTERSNEWLMNEITKIKVYE